jgi:4-hydroxythreonine-4-phosphate dehydrogenase
VRQRQTAQDPGSAVGGGEGRIGITLGDPAGVGPEIVLAALAAQGGSGRSAACDPHQFIIYGDRSLLTRAAGVIGARGVDPDGLEVVEITHDLARRVEPGQPVLEAGAAELAYLEAGTRDAVEGRVAGLVTGPFSKGLAQQATGFPYPGQTEFLAARSGVAEVVMLMAGPRLRVALATTHLALADVPAAIRAGAVERSLLVLGRAMASDFGCAAPRLGVCALNPHAGEGGLFGDEDPTSVAPQIEVARGRLAAEGIHATIDGPLPADTLFHEAVTSQRWDALLALYHDQGLGPIKVLDFEHTVNVTLGLPLVRTAPDHGVAYRLAGKGTASWVPMASALEQARAIASRRRGAGRPPR